MLSYTQTASGALLAMVARSRGEFAPSDVEPSGNYRPCGTFPADRFTATDDRGPDGTVVTVSIAYDVDDRYPIMPASF